MFLVIVNYGTHPSLQGKGKSTKEILKRIDYGGSATLMLFVRSMFSYPFCPRLTLAFVIGRICSFFPQ